MLYLAQVIIYTGILWAVYMLLLRNRPMHAFNRAYLLAICVLPVVIPFIKLNAFTKYFESNRLTQLRLPEVVVNGAVQQQTVNTTDWVLTGYVSVCVLLLTMLLSKWIMLRRTINKHTRIKEPGYTILLNTKYGPGSWGRYILLPDEELNETVIQHEAAHVMLRHSADVMAVSLIQCLFWPNLFLIAIKKELKQVHEFQADASVDMDRLQYSQMLVANLFNTCTLPLTHSFIIHPIKRRIMMLKKRNNKPLSMVIGALAIMGSAALVFNMVALQSCKAKKWEVIKIEEADKAATFKGDMASFLGDNTKYPKAAMDNAIEGRVVVRFIVDETGKVKNPEVISENIWKGNDKQVPDNGSYKNIFANAALEVVRKMPDWIPAEKSGKKVAIYYELPFRFELYNDAEKMSFREVGKKAGAKKSDAKKDKIKEKMAEAEALSKKVAMILENDGALKMNENGTVDMKSIEPEFTRLGLDKKQAAMKDYTPNNK